MANITDADRIVAAILASSAISRMTTMQGVKEHVDMYASMLVEIGKTDDIRDRGLEDAVDDRIKKTANARCGMRFEAGR